MLASMKAGREQAGVARIDAGGSMMPARFVEVDYVCQDDALVKCASRLLRGRESHGT